MSYEKARLIKNAYVGLQKSEWDTALCDENSELNKAISVLDFDF